MIAASEGSGNIFRRGNQLDQLYEFSVTRYLNFHGRFVAIYAKQKPGNLGESKEYEDGKTWNLGWTGGHCEKTSLREKSASHMQNLHCSAIPTLSRGIVHIPVPPLRSEYSQLVVFFSHFSGSFFSQQLFLARQQAVLLFSRSVLQFVGYASTIWNHDTFRKLVKLRVDSGEFKYNISIWVGKHYNLSVTKPHCPGKDIATGIFGEQMDL
ncbi:hypothetical protein H5410_033294 [Solanum commersonii]|uniref:Uncharacterized protein n=1 Tax=Solanum commersonii TaxID=4109 RepID=A0A9J5YS48_SOLCO|nr:hypothetical protein H5410_033294 [Solanum commersonii]